jgi:hypothetical protein
MIGSAKSGDKTSFVSKPSHTIFDGTLVGKASAELFSVQ